MGKYRDIFETIKESIAFVIGRDEDLPQKYRDPKLIKPKTQLKEDLGLDSLDTYELIYDIEERLGIDIDEWNVKDRHLKTAGNLTKYILRREMRRERRKRRRKRAY